MVQQKSHDLVSIRTSPGVDPLGRRIIFRGEDTKKENPVMEVVGVVPTLRDSLMLNAEDVRFLVEIRRLSEFGHTALSRISSLR